MPAKMTGPSLAGGAKHISKRIAFSYLIDWILILGTAAVGGGFSKITGNRHAFSINDPAISFPYKPHDTVSLTVLIIVSLLAPAIIIALISLLLIPGPTAARSIPQSLIWRRRIWEWNTGWMGLGVALAGSFMVTEGLKDIYGKPRPDLLARCQPDLTKLAQYTVSGLGQQLSEAAVIVDWHICQQPDSHVLSDGFASFPSGHACWSWAGMTYLTLFVCAKFGILIPFLHPASYSRSTPSTFHQDSAPDNGGRLVSTAESVPARNQAAAPPVYLLILAFIPLGTALFISGSRWVDYRHHGFDIISGSLLGFIFAWFGFRLYHLPIRRGAGWSWGPRTKGHAFYIAVGTPSYAGDEDWDSGKSATLPAGDVESGYAHGHTTEGHDPAQPGHTNFSSSEAI